MRVLLEMRLTGGSNIILAPQRGNTYGTCSIEVLTSLLTPKADWESFVQEMLDLWGSYKDEKGLPLMIRPHWAKQWAGFSVRGKPVLQYFQQEAFKSAFQEFRQVYKGIVEKRGSTVEETRRMFSNAMLEQLIFS